MKFFSRLFSLFWFFSVYTDSFEKKADRFLERLGRNSKKQMLALMQEDLVRLTLFFEYKFMAYRSLKKSRRTELYRNAGLIAEDFFRYLKNAGHGRATGFPPSLKGDERAVYLAGIMSYLRPGDRLIYEPSATFSKLLRDPSSEKLKGDCNQIVTLYAYLYSLRYPLTDLNVKILQEHICLHYRGFDIETTAGQFTEYPRYLFIGGIEELVAANLLDIPDPSEKQFDLSPANLLRSAQVAYYFSGHRQIVEKNLLIATRNMAFGYLKKKRYREALSFFVKAGDAEGEKACYQAELADLLSSFGSCKTIGDFRNRRSALRRVRELAAKINHREAMRLADETLRSIQ